MKGAAKDNDIDFHFKSVSLTGALRYEDSRNAKPTRHLSCLSKGLEMIVCRCRGVSEKAIRKSVRRGHRKVSQVSQATGAGTGCGTCRQTVKSVVRDEREKVSAEDGGVGSDSESSVSSPS